MSGFTPEAEEFLAKCQKRCIVCNTYYLDFDFVLSSHRLIFPKIDNCCSDECEEEYIRNLDELGELK